jgi:tRNA (guanine37-N1)-methyltransferase
MPKKSTCLIIDKQNGEKTRMLTSKFSAMDKTIRIQKKENEQLCIPLKRKLNKKELTALKKIAPEFKLTTCEFSEQKKQEKTLPEILAENLPPHLVANLPKALDVIGDIAIVEIPPELEIYKETIGNALLKIHHNVKTVLAKAGAITGTYRLRNFEFIAGEKRTNTIYKENGCLFQIDMAKAYFSPRLSHEHQRVATLVKEGETVIDLFAGVGPFAVLIAKTHKSTKVYAIDINPEAAELLKNNIKLNRLGNKVCPIIGDSRQIINENLSGIADRVIMNLPETASEFIDIACKALKPSGGIIHFYGFIRLPENIESMQNNFAKMVDQTGRKVEKIQNAKTVRASAPYEWQAVIDSFVH